MIKINPDRVQHLASSLESIRLASDFPIQVSPEVKAPRNAALLAFLWAAAICHSTQGGLKGYYNGVLVKGWDYLLRAFCCAAEESDTNVSVKTIKSISGDDLRNLLTRFAIDPTVTLNDLERRAEILNECASELEDKYHANIEELLLQAQHKVDGASGVYSQLGNLSAFIDPLKKKSSAFLMTVHFSGLWKVNDQENIVPMIDYHRMRLLCRTGCIEIQDQVLLNTLIKKEPVDPSVENELRKATAEVLNSVVRITGWAMFDLDVIIWAHARSCCRHTPVCISGELENDSFYNYIDNQFDGKCVFQAWCPGYQDLQYRDIWEPNVATEMY